MGPTTSPRILSPNSLYDVSPPPKSREKLLGDNEEANNNFEESVTDDSARAQRLGLSGLPSAIRTPEKKTASPPMTSKPQRGLTGEPGDLPSEDNGEEEEVPMEPEGELEGTGNDNDTLGALDSRTDSKDIEWIIITDPGEEQQDAATGDNVLSEGGNDTVGGRNEEVLLDGMTFSEQQQAFGDRIATFGGLVWNSDISTWMRRCTPSDYIHGAGAIVISERCTNPLALDSNWLNEGELQAAVDKAGLDMARLPLDKLGVGLWYCLPEVELRCIYYDEEDDLYKIKRPNPFTDEYGRQVTFGNRPRVVYIYECEGGTEYDALYEVQYVRIPDAIRKTVHVLLHPDTFAGQVPQKRGFVKDLGAQYDTVFDDRKRLILTAADEFQAYHRQILGISRHYWNYLISDWDGSWPGSKFGFPTPQKHQDTSHKALPIEGKPLRSLTREQWRQLYAMDASIQIPAQEYRVRDFVDGGINFHPHNTEVEKIVAHVRHRRLYAPSPLQLSEGRGNDSDRGDGRAVGHADDGGHQATTTEQVGDDDDGETLDNNEGYPPRPPPPPPSLREPSPASSLLSSPPPTPRRTRSMSANPNNNNNNKKHAAPSSNASRKRKQGMTPDQNQQKEHYRHGDNTKVQNDNGNRNSQRVQGATDGDEEQQEKHQQRTPHPKKQKLANDHPINQQRTTHRSPSPSPSPPPHLDPLPPPPLPPAAVTTASTVHPPTTTTASATAKTTRIHSAQTQKRNRNGQFVREGKRPRKKGGRKW